MTHDQFDRFAGTPAGKAVLPYALRKYHNNNLTVAFGTATEEYVFDNIRDLTAFAKGHFKRVPEHAWLKAKIPESGFANVARKRGAEIDRRAEERRKANIPEEEFPKNYEEALRMLGLRD